jgi:3-methyladenine DNA glycosylase AlkD
MTDLNPTLYFQPLEKSLERIGNVTDAAYMRSYMKEKFEFIGVKQSPRRKTFNHFTKTYGVPAYENIGEFLHWLYDKPEREYHYCAMELLLKTKRKWDENLPILARFLITKNSWWDTVDLIASNIVGAYFMKNPERISEYIPSWVSSENLWLNRTAILFQLKYRDQTDTNRLVQAILPHIDSNEFFHQKAIGWALREYSKHNADWVRSFCEEHELKPLSRREALRILKKEA